jgi:integrase
MRAKPKRKSLPKPSVFKHGDRWVCEYYCFDAESGRPKAVRRSFARELVRQGIEPSVSNQRRAALTLRDEILKKRSEEERLQRREREQTYLTLKELKEAKAAFAIFNQIPLRNKSLVDAVIQYRDNLKLAADSPPLRQCVDIFLARKREAADDEKGQRLSFQTFRTLRQRLNNFVGYFEAKGLGEIRLGEVTSKHLIGYFEDLDVSERTRRNYSNDIGNFFNDAADPRDKHRFINENPMDGVYVHFRKFNKGRSARNGQNGKPKAPHILQIDQVKHVLKVAMQARETGMLGFTVAGLFLGMRPSEVLDMSEQEDFWNRYIRLEEGIVRIDGVGKRRDQRVILMSDNCRVWFQYLKDQQLPFCYVRKKTGVNLPFATFRARAFLPEADAERLIKLRRKRRAHNAYTGEEATFVDQCNTRLGEFEDVLRHTFGSNFYYANGCDKNRTIEQMGHSSEVFVEHYRGLLDNPKNAQEYFKILPSDIL